MWIETKLDLCVYKCIYPPKCAAVFVCACGEVWGYLCGLDCGLDMFRDALWADGSQQLPYHFTEWRGGGWEGPRQECEMLCWFSPCQWVLSWESGSIYISLSIEIFISVSVCLSACLFYIYHIRCTLDSYRGFILKWNDKITFDLFKN